MYSMFEESSWEPTKKNPQWFQWVNGLNTRRGISQKRKCKWSMNMRKDIQCLSNGRNTVKIGYKIFDYYTGKRISWKRRFWQECGVMGALVHCGWECSLAESLWETVCDYLIKLKLRTSCDPRFYPWVFALWQLSSHCSAKCFLEFHEDFPGLCKHRCLWVN